MVPRRESIVTLSKLWFDHKAKQYQTETTIKLGRVQGTILLDFGALLVQKGIEKGSKSPFGQL